VSLLLPTFISYRREDSQAEATALARLLQEEFGDREVFLDHSSIDFGSTWPKEIDEALSRSKTILVVIGPKWLGSLDQWQRRRIDNEADWVRREIVRALNDNKTVVPVLIREAKLPPAEALPEPLKSLPQKQKIDLRGDYWSHDVQLLLSQFEAPQARLRKELSAALAEKIAFCRERDLKFRSAHLLAAVLNLPGEFASACFEMARRGYGGELRQLIDAFLVKQGQKESERGFEEFVLEEHPVVLDASARAKAEGADALDERHLLLAFLDSASSLSEQIRKTLGTAGYAKLCRAVQQHRPGLTNIGPTPDSLFENPE
jgi:TIR domain